MIARLTLLLALVAAGCAPLSAPIQVPVGATCVVKATGLDCTPAPTAPATYVLTIALVGGGTATTAVAPAGLQPAGTIRTLTVTPTGGSQLGAWSAGCADTMPQPAADTVCTRTVTPGTVPPGTATLTWESKGTCIDAACYSGGYQSYGLIGTTAWSHWPAGGAHACGWGAGPPATMTCKSEAQPPAEGPGAAAHNCGQAAALGHLFLGACGPIPQPGSYYWAPDTGRYLKYATSQPPCHTNAMMGYDPQAQALYCFGGYSPTTKFVGKLDLRAGLPPTTPPLPANSPRWSTIPYTTGPPVTTDVVPPNSSSRLAATRGGFDPARGVLWFVDDAADLWRWKEGAGWTRHETAGTKPVNGTVLGLDTVADHLVGWAGNVHDGLNTPIRKSYILNQQTLVWSAGPSGSSGTPTASTFSGMVAFTGPDGRAWFVISTGASTLWRAVVSAGAQTPPPTALLSTTKSGTGNLTGPLPSGPTVVGSDVVLPGAAADSTLTGITPTPPCAQEFKMPAADTSCTVAVAKTETPVPPVGYPDVGPSFPRRALVPVSCDPTFDRSPWPCNGGSKHQRWLSDTKGNVWTGFGDTNPSHHAGNPSQGQGYRLNTGTGVWQRWNPACRPAGQVQPSYPDEVIWAAQDDDTFWLLGGVTQGSDGATCNSGGGESGSTLYKTGLFRYTPSTDRWERITGPGGTNALYGHFDTRDGVLLYTETGGCGSQLIKLNVTTLARTVRDVCLSANPYPGSPAGTFENYADLRVHPHAWDQVGRVLYVVGYHDEYIAGSPSGKRPLRFWRVNVDTGAVTRLPDPPVPGTAQRNPDANSLVWTGKLVVYPSVVNHCGVVDAMLSFDPVAGTWTSHPTTPASAVPGGAVRGNTAVYSKAHDVVVLGGSVACPDWGYPGMPALTHYFLWRG